MKSLVFVGLSLIVMCCESAAQIQVQEAFPGLPAFSRPLELTQPPDGSNRFFVVEQDGRIWVFSNDSSVTTRQLFIDLSDSVEQGGSETGLLGLAFHPDYATNGYFFVNYTAIVGSRKSYITRFRASESNPDSADRNSRTIFLVQNQPYSNHNGGRLAFGPDGYLYIALGDGGSGGDPQGNGQNRATLLGKILRIDVDSASNGRQYSIPPTNPYYGNTQGFKEEIYAYGLRNTWKFSFDPLTGRLWAGDVGQVTREEIDIIDAGGNYGWNKMEGFLCYGTCDTTGKNLLRPVWDYPRSQGYSVTGGYVYRGTAIPSLVHKYIYGDYGTGRIWALTFNGTSFTNTQLYDASFFISSFGVDAQQNQFVVSYGTGRIFKLTGPSTGLTLLSPNDGEAYLPDSTLQITWLASGPANVDLAFKSSPSLPWETIATNVDASIGSFTWTAPSLSAKKARIRVTESGGGLVDSSDGFFRINLAQILVPRSAMDFDTVFVGATRSDTLRIWNSGTGDLSIDSIVTGTTIFWAEPSSMVILEGSVDTIHVNCTPGEVPGTYTDTLRIYFQGSGSPVLVPLQVITVFDPLSISNDAVPGTFALLPNHPNPFNPTTTIRFVIPDPSRVRLRIFNTLGQIVRTWLRDVGTPGLHEVVWDGRSGDGSAAASGVYVCRLEAGKRTASRKMLLLK